MPRWYVFFINVTHIYKTCSINAVDDFTYVYTFTDISVVGGFEYFTNVTSFYAAAITFSVNSVDFFAAAAGFNLIIDVVSFAFVVVFSVKGDDVVAVIFFTSVTTLGYFAVFIFSVAILSDVKFTYWRIFYWCVTDMPLFSGSLTIWDAVTVVNVLKGYVTGFSGVLFPA